MYKGVFKMANNNNKGMKPKKVGNAEFFVNGVVVVNNTTEGTQNPFNGNIEYQIGIAISEKDLQSINTIKTIENQLQKSLNLSSDNENLYLYSKSKNTITVIDKDNNTTILNIGDVVTVFVNVAVWEFGNQQNVGIYCQGVVKIGTTQKATIFERYQQIQNNNADYTKSLECYQYNDTKQLQPPIYPNEYSTNENEENINFNDLPQLTFSATFLLDNPCNDSFIISSFCSFVKSHFLFPYILFLVVLLCKAVWSLFGIHTRLSSRLFKGL